MLRAATVVIAALLAWPAVPPQGQAVLRIKVSIVDAERRPVPVARHALLISDNPSTAPPRRVVTSSDGTAQLPLRPGNYTVESDRPYVIDGRAYEWTQTIDIVAGRDATMELTPSNATVGAATPEVLRDAAAAGHAGAPRGEAILSAWQRSTLELWTPLTRAAGALADANGLVVTSARAIGNATALEVQIAANLKVAGAVLATNAGDDVAVVRVHPAAVAGIPPVPFACDETHPTDDAGTYVIDLPLFGAKDVSDSLVVSTGAAGGPVFAADARAIGLSSPAAPDDAGPRVEVRLVEAARVCRALATARARLDAGAPPDPSHLPVEPPRSAEHSSPVAADALAPSLDAYRLSSQDFDVTFLTPALLSAVRAKRDWTSGPAAELNGRRAATEFEQWEAYVVDAPAVLFVRVTPRLVEGFWTKLARGAASTQGAQIPPLKRLRPGVSRLRLLCGRSDVIPIHPFLIQARVTETEAIDEGFYVFDPAAVGPDCGTVSVMLSSVKAPSRTETRVVDPAIVRRVWDDFAVVRAARSLSHVDVGVRRAAVAISHEDGVAATHERPAKATVAGVAADRDPVHEPLERAGAAAGAERQ